MVGRWSKVKSVQFPLRFELGALNVGGGTAVIL